MNAIDARSHAIAVHVDHLDVVVKDDGQGIDSHDMKYLVCQRNRIFIQSQSAGTSKDAHGTTFGFRGQGNFMSDHK